jgi:GH25 family lysozyme M1 (1,4-beta-N-acetylmuramidase)
VAKPLNGIDVSHHQKPSAINWKARPADLTFAYVRALYGTKPDTACEEHCRNASRAGLDVGLYTFVRDDQTVDAQWEAIEAAVEEHSYSEAPCMAIDAESQYKNRTPDPKVYVPMVNELLRRCKDTFGEVLLYTNLFSFWPAMGRPQEWLQYPLWVADYRSGLISPPTYGLAIRPHIWQHTVAPVNAMTGQANIDQNSLHRPIPRFT